MAQPRPRRHLEPRVSQGFLAQGNKDEFGSCRRGSDCRTEPSWKHHGHDHRPRRFTNHLCRRGRQKKGFVCSFYLARRRSELDKAGRFAGTCGQGVGESSLAEERTDSFHRRCAFHDGERLLREKTNFPSTCEDFYRRICRIHKRG